MDIKSLRQLINDNPRTKDGYPRIVREAAACYARWRRERGAVWSKIEAEIGVTSTSLRSWMASTRPAAFQQVVVVDEPPPVFAAELVITSPNGFTLTGCSLEQAARVLRSLQ
jgi:hypothetical protein